MSEHDPGAAMRERVGNNDLQRELGATLVARMVRHMDAAGLIVGMRDPQLFNGRIAVGETAGEEGAGRGETIELQRSFGTLIPHARDLCDRRRTAHLNRLGCRAKLVRNAEKTRA